LLVNVRGSVIHDRRREMYARVATYEGADSATVDEAAQNIRDSERPEGVPATAFYFLTDRASGKVITIGLFETEDDLRLGNETLNGMSPPGGGFGKRASVDLMEVVAHVGD
jgi:hypothetical protein